MLELDGLTVEYGDLTAVDDVSLAVAEGELCCLLGPSGSGKSTVLRAISGFETPAAGRIRIDGVDVTDAPPNERDCSLVFQDWALFPRQTASENVAFGLKMDGVGTAERETRAREMLELVEMEGYGDAYPDQLSGGQKQRVALARSLAVDPDLLLLDEPSAGLAPDLVSDMFDRIDRINDSGTAVLMVEQNAKEALRRCDRGYVLVQGENSYMDDGDELLGDEEVRQEFLGG